MTTSARALAFSLPLAFAGGCASRVATDPPAQVGEASTAGEPTLVPNLDARPGDTTLCPYSGRPFVVKAEHPKVEYEGEHYWVCSEEAAQKVRADPSKYFDGFEE